MNLTDCPINNSRWRISSRSHEAAFETLIEEVSNLKMLEIRRDDDLDWVYAQDYLHCQLWRQNTCLLLTDLYRASMRQSHDDVPLEIDIRHAFEVSATTRITKEDVTLSHIVAVSSSGEQGCLSPPLGLRADQYTLIRLSKVEDRRYWRRLIQK